jgi:hypothetical protein
VTRARLARLALVGHQRGEDGGCWQWTSQTPRPRSSCRPIDWLGRARALGADVNTMITPLQQVYDSLVTA